MKPIKLRLTLDTSFLDEEEFEILKEFGKVNKGIIREIVVPDTMTLHSLHYAIQKCFGWNNNHLHKFMLPNKLYEEMVEDQYINYKRLAGIYFKFPDEDDDNFWDDNYDGEVRFDTWLKYKYQGPYSYGGISEYYLSTIYKILSFEQNVPSITTNMSFQDYMRRQNGEEVESKAVKIQDATLTDINGYLHMGSGFTELLEKNTIADLLTRKKVDIASVIDDLDNQRQGNVMEAIQQINALHHYFDSADFTKYSKELNDKIDEYMHLLSIYEVLPYPVTKTLDYFYDYGDDWYVKIDYVGVYKGDQDIIEKVMDEKPVCIYADGLPVLDDVGGIHGYVEHLYMLKFGDEEEKEERKAWAKSQGWTGRNKKASNIL